MRHKSRSLKRTDREREGPNHVSKLSDPNLRSTRQTNLSRSFSAVNTYAPPITPPKVPLTPQGLGASSSVDNDAFSPNGIDTSNSYARPTQPVTRSCDANDVNDVNDVNDMNDMNDMNTNDEASPLTPTHRPTPHPPTHPTHTHPTHTHPTHTHPTHTHPTHTHPTPTPHPPPPTPFPFPPRACNRTEVREHLQRLAEDVRLIHGAHEVALPSPTLELHVASQKRVRSASMASIAVTMPITFEIALDTVVAFMQANLDDIERCVSGDPVRACASGRWRRREAGGGRREAGQGPGGRRDRGRADGN